MKTNTFIKDPNTIRTSDTLSSAYSNLIENIRNLNQLGCVDFLTTGKFNGLDRAPKIYYVLDTFLSEKTAHN